MAILIKILFYKPGLELVTGDYYTAIASLYVLNLPFLHRYNQRRCQSLLEIGLHFSLTK
jgi:hypothetical protein